MDPFATNFSEYATGAGVPTAWSTPWVTSGMTVSIVDDGGVTGGKLLRVATSSGVRCAIYPDVTAGLTHGSLLMRCRLSAANTTSHTTGPVIRGGGVAAAENGIRWAMNGTSARLSVYNAGGFTDLQTGITFSTFSPNVWYCFKIEVNGNRLRGKVWAGDVGDEPPHWTFAHNDATHASGWFGLVLTATGSVDVDVFEVTELAAEAIEMESFHFWRHLAGNLVTLAPRQTFNSKWWHLSTKLEGMDGLTPVFTTTANATGEHHQPLNVGTAISDCRAACYSYDYNPADGSGTWFSFDNQSLINVFKPDNLRFSNNAPFASDTVYIATYPLYPFVRTQAKVAEWLASSYCAPSPSADVNGVLDTASAHTDSLVGPSSVALSGEEYYGLVITDPAYTGSKNKHVLTSGNHACETMGHFSFEGAVDWLLSSDTNTKRFRRYNEVYIYPHINPQGNRAGYYRSEPEGATQDHNRNWTDVSPALESHAIIRAAILADTGGVYHGSIDYHTFGNLNSTSGNSFFYGSAAFGANAAFLTAVRGFDANVSNTLQALPGSSLNDWLRDEETGGNMQVAVTSETSCLRSHGLDDWKSYGRYQMQALAALGLANTFEFSSPDITSDLVSRWKFDEGAGSTAADSVGSNHGTAGGTAAWANGMLRKAFDFTGSNSMNVGNSNTLSITPDITVSWWHNADGLGGGGLGRVYERGTGTGGIAIFVASDSGNKLRVAKPDGSLVITSTGTITLSTWEHWAVTISGTTATFYKNGVAAGSGTFTGGLAASADQSAIIGNRAAGSRAFDGRIDDLRIWSRALTHDEVVAVYEEREGIYAPAGGQWNDPVSGGPVA